VPGPIKRLERDQEFPSKIIVGEDLLVHVYDTEKD
jgi:hypothetical protein